MQTFIESLTLPNTLMLIGIIGALIMIPLKDILTLDFYDICDVFFSLFFVGLLTTTMDEETYNNMFLLTGLFLGISIAIIIIKISVFIPFQRRLETNALLSRKDYIGERGKVTVAIAKDSLGEVVLYTIFGNVPMTAKIFNATDEEELVRIATGQMIRVMDIQESVVFVAPYEEKSFLPPNETRWGK